ncbi:MAG: type II secretion system F family protein [Myxococcales bacterium]|nr:type II secretion system F family protein [Myxococcales bacterium]
MNASVAQLGPFAWLGVVMFALGLGASIYITLTDEESPLAKQYFRYTRHLDVQLRALFIHDITGKNIANWQIVAILVALLFDPVLTLLLGEGTDVPVALVGVPVAVAAPALWFIDARHKRQEAIEKQLDTFLLALANALKASPSLGDALNATSTLLRAPMKQELELTVKENQLGVPLDHALLNMATRVGSRAFSGALTTVLIGRQTGGDLPRILETSAATLREMARLEGVVRTKTAEGKAQAWVLGVVPPLLVGLLNWLDPLWLQPLSTTFIGYIIVAIAVAFWVAAIFAARRILAVDI